MRFVIFSDLHDNLDGLYRVLANAEAQYTDRLIYLGDVGREPRLFEELQRLGIDCIFGNWEVSGFQRLPPGLTEWVATWPAMIRSGAAIFCHATPDLPVDVTTTTAAAAYMRGGIGWSSLFPRLHTQESARWHALAALEAADLRVAFHGHTHVQMVWAWQTGKDGERRLRSFTHPTTFRLEAGAPDAPNRYLVGVGSAGQPDDGPRLRYALYDAKTGEVQLRRL